MVFQQFLFLGKNVKEKENVSAFLANSTPVIRRNECQKTFGESPRRVCTTIHAFDITNPGIGYTRSCENFSMPRKNNEKQEFC